jgi:hypothetical protein
MVAYDATFENEKYMYQYITYQVSTLPTKKKYDNIK